MTNSSYESQRDQLRAKRLQEIANKEPDQNTVIPDNTEIAPFLTPPPPSLEPKAQACAETQKYETASPDKIPPVPPSVPSVSGSKTVSSPPASPSSAASLSSSVPTSPTTPSSESIPPVVKTPPTPGSTTSGMTNSSQSPSAIPVSPAALPDNPKRVGAMLKTDIGKIVSQIANSSLRSMVAGYLRLVSDHFKNDGDSHFPHGIQPHPQHTHRCRVSAFNNVLLFHVGRAILAYYAIERGEATDHDVEAIRFIRVIAVLGVTSFRVKGGDQRGYALFAVDNHELLKQV